jgi:hypothetical protein
MKHIKLFESWMNEATPDQIKATRELSIAAQIQNATAGNGTDEKALTSAIISIPDVASLTKVNQILKAGHADPQKKWAYPSVGNAINGELGMLDASYKNQIMTHIKKIKAEQYLNSFTEPASAKAVTPAVDFGKIVGNVIDNLEGGYYHPDMLKDGRVKDGRYSASGETMMGIDREKGGTINTTPEGIKFWNLIDLANARSEWKWLHRGGQLEPQLRELTGKMIKPLYDKFSTKYLSGPALKIVNSNPKLLFNFAYSVWNGEGWFNKFAEEVNKAVSRGVTDPEELAALAVKNRINSGNSLISQGGQKIAKLLNLKV